MTPGVGRPATVLRASRLGEARLRNSRPLILALIASYVGLFSYIYVAWASPAFYYFGFTYAPSTSTVAAALVAIAVFAFALPRSIGRLSDFVIWLIFMGIYIPMVMTAGMQGTSLDNATLLIASLAVSFFLIVKIPRIYVRPPFRLATTYSSDRFFLMVCVLYFLILFYYMYSYGSLLSFSTFGEIYEQRARYAGAQSTALAVYATGWLATALNPYLIATGLLDRSKRLWLFIGIFGQLLVYMGSAGKIVFAIVLVTLCFFAFVVRNGGISVARLVIGCIILLLLILLALVLTGYRPTGIALDLLSVGYMRTLGIQGAMAGVYADFFTANPHTYWSHVNFVATLINYPYTLPLGYVIGTHLVGGAGFNANASFWVTDGIAAFGYAGIVLIGGVFGFLLAIANRLVPADRLVFGALLAIPFVMFLANTSLFTSLITGGGLLIAILLLYGAPQRSQLLSGASRVAWEAC